MALTLNTVPLSLNAPMLDRIRYALDTINPEDLYEYVKGLEDIRQAINNSDLEVDLHPLDADDPSDVIEKALDSLKERSIESLMDNPYADFFDDCVGALNGHWPAASIEDETLKAVILDAITKGDE